MPFRDMVHLPIKQALTNDGWETTDDPYVISYGERFLVIDLAAEPDSSSLSGQFVGARRGTQQIAVEIETFRGKSAIADLEQAIGQYSLYCLLLNELDPDREVYLAVTDIAFSEIFDEPIGKLVIQKLPLKLVVIDVEAVEVVQWIP